MGKFNLFDNKGNVIVDHISDKLLGPVCDRMKSPNKGSVVSRQVSDGREY